MTKNIINFKKTITNKGRFYFIKYEGGIWGNKTLGRFIRVSKDKFEHIEAGMDCFDCFHTIHKEGVKTEHYFCGRY